MYGSDRVALAVAEALAARCALEVWLPDDGHDGHEHGADGHAAHGPLTARLRQLGIPVTTRTLPILRRRNLTIPGVARLLSAALATRRALRRERFDIVYLATSACAVVAPLARSSGSGSIVLHVQEQWRSPEKYVLRMLAAACTQVVAISRSALLSTGYGHSGRAALIPNAAADYAGLRESALREPAGEPPLRYLVASRWCRGKGHATLLRAWELAGCPGELVVLGGPPELGRPVDVRRLISEQLSRPETVTVIGEVADPAPYLARSDVVLLPSDSAEGLGLVIIEAASAGIPAIASRTGGPEDIIVDGVSGWLFDPGDAERLAEIIGGLNRGGLRRAGENAREQYERQFTAELFRWRMNGLLNSELVALAGGPR